VALTHTGGVISAQYNGLNYPVTTVEYLVVAGGGGGAYGGNPGGGGGAGGLLTATGYAVTIGSTITITVGAGGPGFWAGVAYNGSNSVFGNITALGGGVGNGALTGGSGGGGLYNTNGSSGTPGQGNNGGNGSSTNPNYGGGGGGGAGSAGLNAASPIWAGDGGAGLVSSITGSPVQYAGGGGGGGYNAARASLGGGGGGGNGINLSNTYQPGYSGVANTGGGGGGIGAGGGTTPTGGAGGSGIVVIRYPAYQVQATSTTGSPTTYIAGPYRVYIFYASGTITF